MVTVDNLVDIVVRGFIRQLLPILLVMLLISAAAILLKTYLRYWSFNFLNRRLINRARSRDDLLSADPEQFEHLCRLLFEKQGYKVHTTSMCGDSGVDIVGAKDGKRIIAQCKRYTSKPCGRPALQQFYGAFEDERADHGFFITTSRFTNEARHYAARKPITLVDGNELIRWINNYADGQVQHQPSRALQNTPASQPTGTFTAICASCGCETHLPFEPITGKPVYCKKCYMQRRRRR